ncbi:MAG: DUF5683 domain-containing protein [Haloarculaceae archaeon]
MTPDEGRKGPEEVYCFECGAIIKARAEICPECGVRQRRGSTLDEVLEGGNPFVAALLSIVVPGLGQLYNRELEKALVFFVGFGIAVFSMLFLVGFVAAPVIYLWALYDAYTVADRQGQARGVAGPPGR